MAFECHPDRHGQGRTTAPTRLDPAPAVRPWQYKPVAIRRPAKRSGPKSSIR